MFLFAILFRSLSTNFVACKFVKGIVWFGANWRFTLAVFTLEDEQIVWTDKSCDGLFDYCEFKMANSANFQANFPQTMAPFANSIPPTR